MDVANTLLKGILYAARTLWKGFTALLYLKPPEIWGAIKRAYAKFEKWLRWYQQRIQKPIDDLRARVMDIYRKIFRPLLAPLETLRSMVRLISAGVSRTFTVHSQPKKEHGVSPSS